MKPDSDGPMEKDNLKYLKNSKIDFKKWDQCIEGASNSRVYATSWFLDRTSTVWDALVWDDYKYIMPLPVRTKWGIKYLYQPFFCQQHGIFPPPPFEIQSHFANALARRFRFMEFQANSLMNPDAFPGFTLTKKVNFILPLHESYATLSSRFKRNARYHISNAYKKGIRIVHTLDTKQYVELKRINVTTDVSSESFQVLYRIISWCQNKENGRILAALTPSNEICGAAFFIEYGNRLIFLNSFSTPDGRRLKAMYAILDEIIRKNAKSGLLFDFEGSSVESIATFFKSFSPAEEFYYHVYLNNLPFPLNYLKRKQNEP